MRTPYDQELQSLQVVVDEFSAKHHDMRVLEAGCGSLTHIRLPSECLVDGIDLSEKQLERNVGLNQKIHGDLETHPLPEAAYDIVVCWDVLEHISNPQQALRNIFQTTRPGGLVVLAMPNVNSFEAQITKWSPHKFHVLILRYVFGRKKAGIGGRGPFKTYLRPEIAIDRIEQYANEHRFRSVFRKHYDRGRVAQFKKRAPALHFAYQVVSRAADTLTNGRIEPVLSSSFLILKKNNGVPGARDNPS